MSRYISFTLGKRTEPQTMKAARSSYLIALAQADYRFGHNGPEQNAEKFKDANRAAMLVYRADLARIRKAAKARPVKESRHIMDRRRRTL